MSYSENDACFGPERYELFLGADNALVVTPIENGLPMDLSTTTDVVVAADPEGSTVTGDAITASSSLQANNVVVSDADGTWRVYAKLGNFTGMVAGDYRVRVTVFNATHPNGLVVLSDYPITIKDVY